MNLAPIALSIAVAVAVPIVTLGGKQREQGFAAATGQQPARVSFTLFPAADFILRAIDVDTGKGLPDVDFYPGNLSDKDGSLRRMMADLDDSTRVRPVPNGTVASKVARVDGFALRLWNRRLGVLRDGEKRTECAVARVVEVVVGASGAPTPTRQCHSGLSPRLAFVSCPPASAEPKAVAVVNGYQLPILENSTSCRPTQDTEFPEKS